MNIEVKDLSIEEKVGQMLMIGIDMPDAISKINDIILKYKIGGVLLYKKNYKSYKELVNLINYIKELNKANKVPLFIAIDQEGGRVNRMPEDFINLPSAYKLAQYKEENLVKKVGEITGNMLRNTGFNLNFAPVLDIKRFDNDHAIGDRAFSENVNEVSKLGIEYMKQLQSQNVISVIKHYPGHGATKKDSHFTIPVIKEKINNLEKEDMIPFKEAIENGADAILVSHLKIDKVTNKYPASMSRRFITKYIRKKFRYKGLIITDDLRMKAVQLSYGKNKAVKKAFEAGNDVILFKYNNDIKVIEEIIKNVKLSVFKESRVNKSVNRILKTKEKYSINNEEIEYDETFLNKTNKEILEIRNKIERKD